MGPRSLVVELAPLGVADAVELGLSLDPEMGRDQALTLAERSRGFPFWIETLVRSGEQAPDVDRLVTGRLRTATPDAAPLLAVLAVASRPRIGGRRGAMGWPMARIERTVEDSWRADSARTSSAAFSPPTISCGRRSLCSSRSQSAGGFILGSQPGWRGTPESASRCCARRSTIASPPASNRWSSRAASSPRRGDGCSVWQVLHR